MAIHPSYALSHSHIQSCKRRPCRYRLYELKAVSWFDTQQAPSRTPATFTPIHFVIGAHVQSCPCLFACTMQTMVEHECFTTRSLPTPDAPAGSPSDSSASVEVSAADNKLSGTVLDVAIPSPDVSWGYRRASFFPDALYPLPTSHGRHEPHQQKLEWICALRPVLSVRPLPWCRWMLPSTISSKCPTSLGTPRQCCRPTPSAAQPLPRAHLPAKHLPPEHRWW